LIATAANSSLSIKGHPASRARVCGLAPGGFMNKLLNFFGSKSTTAAEPEIDVVLDDEVFLTITRHFSKENESIRSLLTDAEQKIKELDAIKQAIGEQIDPFSKTLRVLDDTKSRLSAAEARVETLEGDCTQLRSTLSETTQKLTTLDSTHGVQSKDLASCRT